MLSNYFLFHLAWAAFLAISLRLFVESLLALALPPLDAPRADKACAWGFFGILVATSSMTAIVFSLPVTLSMIAFAIWVKSLFGMLSICHACSGRSMRKKFSYSSN
jgi:ethanolamine transporter EutH